MSSNGDHYFLGGSNMPDHDTVHLKLDSDEALVLFAFLAREIDAANGARLKPMTNHQAELWALNALQSLLERELTEPFRSDYDSLLSRAQTSLVKKCGDWPD